MLFKPVCYIIILIVLLSCNNNVQKENEFYLQLDSALIRSTEAIQNSTKSKFRSLEEKIADPITSEKAKVWFTKAETVFKITDGIFKFIDTLRNKTNNKIQLAKKNYSQEDSEDFQNRLRIARRQIFDIDPDLSSYFNKKLPFVNDSSNLDLTTGPTLMVLAQLSKIQSNLKTSENMLIEYCDKKVYAHYNGYKVFEAIVYGNSSVYRPGEKATIYAGIGSFSTIATPEISVFGKKFNKTSLGDYEYSYKVSNKPGKYELPVILNYNDPNTGLPASVKKTIRYKVIAECPE